jgi:hypothetical protein
MVIAALSPSSTDDGILSLGRATANVPNLKTSPSEMIIKIAFSTSNKAAENVKPPSLIFSSTTLGDDIFLKEV